MQSHEMLCDKNAGKLLFPDHIENGIRFSEKRIQQSLALVILSLKNFLFLDGFTNK